MIAVAFSRPRRESPVSRKLLLAAFEAGRAATRAAFG